MTEQIEGEVRDAGVHDMPIPGVDRWDVWYVARASLHWVCAGSYTTHGPVPSLAATYKRQGHIVRIVHYVLPALRIEAKEN